MNNDINIEIEKYLFNQMTEKDKAIFEEKLKNDPNLQKELELVQLEHASMELMLEQQLKDQLAAWSKENSSQKGKVITMQPRKKAWTYIGMAASILILLAFGLKFFVINNYTNLHLADEYGSPFLLQERGAELSDDEGLLSLLTSKNYEGVLSALRSKTELTERQIYFRGIAYRETGNIDDATNDFNTLITQTESTQIRENAQWELVITYLKGKDTDELNSALSEILDTPNHSFRQNAEKLSEKVNSIWYPMAN